MGTGPGRRGGHQGCRESQGESELKHQAQKWQKGIEGGELGVNAVVSARGGIEAALAGTAKVSRSLREPPA